MLALLLSSALGAGQIPPPPEPPAPRLLATDASGNGRFERHAGMQDSAWLTERFEQTAWMRDNALRALNGRSPRPLKAYLRSTEYANTWKTLSLHDHLQLDDGTHRWDFEAPDTADGPLTRALEWQDLSDAAGYHVLAILHCYDTPQRCADYRAQRAELPAPKPAATAGEPARQQWRNRVYDEQCSIRPVNMSQPRYPVDALREGISGTVVIGILFNRCGNVRDSWVMQSSRNRSLDRAALDKAQEWQLDLDAMPPGGLQKRVAKIPIRFEFDESLPTQ